jgi:hypothetical protein
MKNRLIAAGFAAIITTTAGTAVDVTPKKSIDEIAKEVINGKWKTGATRKKLLTEAGYDYNAVQKRVNELLR